MKEKRILLLSAFFSILAHLLLVAATFFIWIPGVSGTGPSPERHFFVKTVNLPKAGAAASGQPGGAARAGQVRRLKFENPGASSRQAVAHHFEAAAGAIKTPDNPLAPAPLLAPELGTPRLDATAREALKEQISLPRHSVQHAGAPQQPEILIPQLGVGTGEDLGEKAVPEEFREQMPAFTPARAPQSGGDLSGAGASWEAQALSPFGLESADEHESLDPFLNVSILTFQNSQTHQSYFQVSIYSSPKASELAVIPKEILFLVDASLSIQNRRLHAFREGIKHAIENLNPDDKFNIFVFKDQSTPFAVSSVSTRQEPVANALRFLDLITPSRQTDIYSALFETLQRRPAQHPSYIVLLSDGNPSRGVVSSAKLISEITRTNAQSRPIFSFSGGARVNHFLLDFLSYPNRGWSEHEPLDSHIRERFSNFSDKIQNPLLTNLRYQITSLREAQVYPANLPDFYKDTVLTLYGTYGTETKFSIRILGDSGGKTKEFIYTYDLAEAQKGNENIAREWAFNKVYDLITRMILRGPTAEDKEQIKTLIRDYNLSIPYDFDKIF